MSEPKISSFDWALWFFWMMATSVGWVLGRFLLPNLGFITIGIGIGILQWLVLRQRIRNAWQWMLATTLGWTLGSILVMTVITDGMDFIAGAIIGLSIGAAQWLVLRNELHWAGWWVVISVVAWTTGMSLLPGAMLTGVMAGLVTGIALELLLRYPKSISEAG